jgi:hypothetical protein
MEGIKIKPNTLDAALLETDAGRKKQLANSKQLA